jgi:hypothetical protein
VYHRIYRVGPARTSATALYVWFVEYIQTKKRMACNLFPPFGTRPVTGAQSHRSRTGAQSHRSRTGAQSHRSRTGAQSHRSRTGAQSHRSRTGAQVSGMHACIAGCTLLHALLAVPSCMHCWLHPPACFAGCTLLHALLAAPSCMLCWLYPHVCSAGCTLLCSSAAHRTGLRRSRAM